MRYAFSRALIALIILLTVVVYPVMAAGTVTGTVFRDFNANGIQDAGEPGIGGAQVFAYDSTGASYGPAVSSTTAGTVGDYSITWGGTDTRVRLEVTPPTTGPGTSNLQAGAAGGTTVQFVDDGAVGVDFGLYNPIRYCQDNPNLTVSCYVPGDNSLSNGNAVITYPYNSNGTVGSYPETPIAVADEVGTVFGIAWQPTTESTFVSAYMKRGSNFGSADSTGAIYRIPTGGAPSVFIDLNGLAGINTGPNPHPAGTSAAIIQQGEDSFPLVGKAALGDLEISDDGLTLYTVNLFQRQLIVIPVSIDATNNPVPPTAAQIRRVGVPTPPGCAAADVRPFALKYFEGSLYLGLVCSQESVALAAPPGNQAQLDAIRAGLSAHVYRFSPAANSFVGGPVLSVALNYGRGQLNDNFPSAPLNDGEWLPWTNLWRPAWIPDRGPGTIANPQPMLTDIEIDDDGFMYLGFRDRFADQSYSDGDYNPFLPIGVPFTSGRQGGDLLLACPVGAGWQIENDGSCGGRTSTPAVGVPTASTGPGGREFFWAERFDPFHEETALGGLALLPGSGEVVSSVYDAFDTFEGGVLVFDTATGGRNRGVQLFAPGTNFAKGGGLGDLELQCQLAPVEVGNRVWLDPDKNGVQDPDETPFDGVTVNLYEDTNCDGIGDVLIATTLTAGGGQYYFVESGRSNGAPGTAELPAAYNGGTGRFRIGTCYVVQLDNPADYAAGGPLENLFITLLNGSLDQRDSDGVASRDPRVLASGTNFPRAAFRVGGIGQNNHTYDFGFSPTPPTIVVTPPPPSVAPTQLDPVIVKLVDPAFAQPGQQVVWTIQVNNPHDVDIQNVSFTDTLDDRLSLISVSSDIGTVSSSGQVVSFSIIALRPKETATITIVTRIRPGTPVPFIIENVAIMPTVRSNVVTVISATSLPQTGEHSRWRQRLLTE